MSTRSKSITQKIESDARKFDWAKLDALSDTQIEEAAKSDPDVVLLTDAELAEAEVVIPRKARGRDEQAAE